MARSVLRKSQKISTVSDFLSYIRKTTGGGQFAPPLAGIGFKPCSPWANVCNNFVIKYALQQTVPLFLQQKKVRSCWKAMRN